MKQNVATKVKSLLEDTINEKGFTLWDVTYGKEGGEMLLTVTVDREKDISMEDLSELNVVINDIIDEADPIEDAYSLMLESAGSERTLRTDSHIDFAIEKKVHVELKLYKAIEGIKELEGTILSADENSLVFQAEFKEMPKNQKKGAKKSIKAVEEPKIETKVYTFEKKAISKLCAYL